VFRRKRFFQGRPIHGSSVDDIAWLRPDGQHMTDADWTSGHRVLAIYLNGKGIPDHDDLGERIVDDSFLLLVNAHDQQMTFTLPGKSFGRSWEVATDSADPLLVRAGGRQLAPASRQDVLAHSVQVLLCRTDRRVRD
jgi:isoamylase